MNTMKLTFLGTGTFFIDKDRSASAYLLEIDNKKILIDCGPGTLMRLSQLNVKPKDIDYILITHFHADHTADLFPLFMNYRLVELFNMKQLKRFPKVYGPKGIYSFMVKTARNYRLPALSGWDKIPFYDIKKEQKLGPVMLTAFKVKHVAFAMEAQGYAYRLRYAHKIITFSGDCVKCAGVENACRNADLFICDTSCEKNQANKAHMDTHDVGTIAQKNNVKKVILSHLYPHSDSIDLVAEVKEKYSGEVVRGKDFMVISIL